MKKYFTLIAILLVSLTLTAAPAMRGHNMGTPSDNKDNNMPQMNMQKSCGMMDDLNLTPDQQKQLDDIHFRFEKALIPLRADIKSLRLDMKRALREEKFEDAQKLAEQIGAKKIDIEKLRISHRSDMSKVFTADQKKIMREKHMDMMPGMGGGKNRGMMGGMKGGMRGMGGMCPHMDAPME